MRQLISRFGMAGRKYSDGPFDRCGFIWRLFRYGTVEVLYGAKMSWRSKCLEKLWLSILRRNNQSWKFSWKPISSTSWRSSRKPLRRSLCSNLVRLTEARPRSVASVYGQYLTSCTNVLIFGNHNRTRGIGLTVMLFSPLPCLNLYGSV